MEFLTRYTQSKIFTTTQKSTPVARYEILTTHVYRSCYGGIGKRQVTRTIYNRLGGNNKFIYLFYCLYSHL
jgi:hypothetical protein